MPTKATLPLSDLIQCAKCPEFNSWTAMWYRCHCKSSKQYADYGGRGIKVCQRWEDFFAFYADMGPRPENTTLDRIDVDGHYEPSNCRWADKYIQARNKRKMIFEWRGESVSRQGLAKRTGINGMQIARWHETFGKEKTLERIEQELEQRRANDVQGYPIRCAHFRFRGRLMTLAMIAAELKIKAQPLMVRLGITASQVEFDFDAIEAELETLEIADDGTIVKARGGSFAEFEYQGQRYHLTDLATVTNLSRETIAERLKETGGDVEKAIRLSQEAKAKQERLSFEYEGETIGLSKLARRVGIERKVLWQRMCRDGMSLEDAIKTPIGAHYKASGVEWKGELRSKDEICRMEGIARTTFNRALKKLGSVEAAVEHCKSLVLTAAK